MRRVNLGSVADPKVQGNPLRLEVALAEFGIAGDVSYAVFRMLDDAPVSTPSFVLERGAGITVTSGGGGQFSISMTASHTALWSGRDWHAASMVDPVTGRVDLFSGLVTSTIALRY